MDKRYRTIQQRALNLPHYGAEQELSCLLRECLREEEFVSGDRFLSDRELIELVGKSRSVVRRSVDRLREEGWLERRPGLGTFVAKTASEIETMCGGTKILPEYMDIFITFLKEKKPTVLLFGSCKLAMALLEVINLYEIKLPKQYSFIIWDSDPNINMLYYPLIPTIVPLPLRKMGIKAAELGKKILRHESVPLENVIPGRKILEGNTVVKL
ncbi:MAG: GntR family transcriptional regulator [Planctomycetia bacterium]|nr:GntR family transcriptional regulator [Planctomycetia bacterium]